MAVSNRKLPDDSPVMSKGEFAAHKAVALLEELLTHTLRLRDLYKSARCQAAGIQLLHLRPLFDTHYEEQLALVDLLVDRIRALGGASRVLAGSFLQGTASSYPLRGHLARQRLLCDLLDAHEMVTGAAPALAHDQSAAQDFAVGRVLLTNDQQGRSVQEHLLRLDQGRRFAISCFSGAEAYE